MPVRTQCCFPCRKHQVSDMFVCSKDGLQLAAVHELADLGIVVDRIGCQTTRFTDQGVEKKGEDLEL